MKDFTIIGKILKPQALKGEVRVSPITKDVMQYLTYKYLYVGDVHQKYDIEACRIQEGFVIIKFHGIDSANEAEDLRNQLLYIDKSQLSELDSGEYYIEDLIGCQVLSNLDNESFGVVKAIDEFSKINTITIVKDDKEFMFPFLEDVIDEINIDKKNIYVNKDKLMEVIVDED